MAASSLKFSVRRREPVLVAPASPTPHEFKQLSDIDDQEGLRFQIPVIQFYRPSNMCGGGDPCGVIRDALSRALVYYYPLAGRLREEGAGAGEANKRCRKLTVECTGEGVLFIEAEADVKLTQFGEMLQPPFPLLEELLYDVPGFGEVLNTPLLLIQVTRLLCGGFIFALRLNHTLCDAAGLVLFMNAVAEMARGAAAPSVLPVWERERLMSSRTSTTTTTTTRRFAHREYEEVPDTKGTIVPLDDMVHRSFFFGREQIRAMRDRLPAHLRNSASSFDILTACLWKCRTLALSPDPEEEMRVVCIVNARSRFDPPLPAGYYGNAFAFPVAVSAAGELCGNPLGYAVDLVRAAKAEVDEEYMRSVAELMVLKGRPHFTVVRAYLVSDLTRAGFMDIDFGWGKPLYGGAAKGGVGAIPGVASFYIPFVNARGDKGVVVPVCLPAPAMHKFVSELDTLIKSTTSTKPPPPSDPNNLTILSAL